MIDTTLEAKAKAAYEHGRWDCRAGAPCNPRTPLTVYSDLPPGEQRVIIEAWTDGWRYEYLYGMSA